MEPLTAGAYATLAFTKAFEKTIEKFTEAEAEPLYEEALEIRHRVFGENHSNTVSVRENLENLRAKVRASNFWWGKVLKFW
ncbi:tetratricopeptide repeat protein [Brasilonema sp. UFV-L1]|uniref:tetratricopeptide repeat protein n=1 Tax=Brasilonema sp. UFV-L1 TaxID=2234130 RepID=UPI001B7D24B0|nr:tetratricopeptide repeat protein [Brasilonema sp. UFV-L1]